MLTNVIYCRDNLELMRELPDETLDLIYIDPPFFSNQQYEVISPIRPLSDGFGDGAWLLCPISLESQSPTHLYTYTPTHLHTSP